MQRVDSTKEVTDGCNMNIKNLGVSMSSVPPLPAEISTPFGNDFQRSLFDTPQSLLSSPHYDMFSSPFAGQFNNSTPTPRCSFCSKEIQGRPAQFACLHKICMTCAGLANGQQCIVCMSPASAVTPNFSPNLFLSPNTTPSHKSSSLADASLSAVHNQSYQNVNGISQALQNASLGIEELQDRFNIWENNGSNLDTSSVFDPLGGDVDHLVFSPPPSDQRFSLSQNISQVNCTACGFETRASAFCMACRELLCSDCVGAHLRVSVTKDHPVVRLDQLFNRLPSVKDGSISGGCTSDESSSRPASVCGVHDSRVVCFCDTCKGVALCFHCLPLHAQHQLNAPGDVRSAVQLLISESRQLEKNIEEAVEGVSRMSERVDASVQSVASELRSAIHTHIAALEERKRELLQRLDTIRQAKVASLKTQGERLLNKKSSLAQAIKAVEESSSDDEVSNLSQSFDQLLKVFGQSMPLEPQETDLIKFVSPDSQLLSKIKTLGNLDSGPCARTSTIIGEGFRRAIRDRQCNVSVQLRDACGDISLSPFVQGQITASVLAPGAQVLDCQISEREDGVVVINYLPVTDGIHQLNIMIRGVSISECPVSIDVRHGRNYTEIAHQGELFSFGKEGSGDGELCRPWGICIDLKGRVLVADRSNNRIQIFDKDGNFLSKFGSSGTRGGQFDRPAGITTNTLNHIIVADKDNHRIQTFDENGNFLLKFGERGRPVGMFNYPWGVATNSHNNIAVSDTRNHRVQIFNANGHFIRKCGFDAAYFYKHLDSPRGLCFLQDGSLLITDFNNHRLAVVSSPTEMKVYGSEGDVEGMFCRPQGVKTDSEGHILVCDSKNNRIQVFSGDDFACVAVFGNTPGGFQMPAELPAPFQTTPSSSSVMPFITAPTSAGAFLPSAAPQPPRPTLDRPTDVAVSADGRVYVVDFGNNCIRVY